MDVSFPVSDKITRSQHHECRGSRQGRKPSSASGNEAVARPPGKAGVRVAAAYPGTPATEILENIALYPDIYSEWSVNEKVAVEVAIGASLAGSRPGGHEARRHERRFGCLHDPVAGRRSAVW